MDRPRLGRALRLFALALLAGAAWSASAQERASPPGATPAPDAAATGVGEPPPEAVAPSADEAPAAATAAPPAEIPVTPSPGEAPAAATTAPPAETPVTQSPGEAPAAATAAAPVAAPAAEPGLGPDEVGRRVAETFDVQVLRVRETEEDGRPVYAVTVMLPGGDRNNAFQVVTVLADPDTGDVLPTFRHLPAGIEGNPGLEAETSSEAGIRTMRRQTFR